MVQTVDSAVEDKKLFIAVSIANKDKRESLFKHIDAPSNKKHVFDRYAARRVIDVELFDELQPRIDASPHARVSLMEQNEDGDFEAIIPNAKPMSESYDEMLRRLRF